MPKKMKFEELVGIVENGGTTESIRTIWDSFVPKLTGKFTVWATEGTAKSHDLARMYRVRLKHLVDANRERAGFEETIEALQQETDEIAGVVIETREYTALCFLNSQFARTIGFLYYRTEGEGNKGSTLLLHE